MHCFSPQSCSNLTISLCFFLTPHSLYCHFSFSLMQHQREVTPFILKPHAFQLLSHHCSSKALLLSQISGFLRRIPASVEWQSRIRNLKTNIFRYTLSYLMTLSIDLQQFSLGSNLPIPASHVIWKGRKELYRCYCTYFSFILLILLLLFHNSTLFLDWFQEVFLHLYFTS